MHAETFHKTRPIVAIGDVHGMTELLAETLALIDAEGAFPVLLGDLVDKGPDSVGVLRMVVPRLAAGTMALVRGNHDERLLKSLSKPDGKKTRVLADLMASDDAEDLAAQTAAALSAAPYWISLQGHILVHGAFHPEMLSCPSRGQGADVPRKLKALSLYGETDGSINEEGYPIRTYAWVSRIPEGLTVVVGHDTRQMHEPLVVDNGQGGRAVFLDTGAAKGGRLSTWMIPAMT
jgi:protein phosphatase